jgi:hypothetical protein
VKDPKLQDCVSEGRSRGDKNRLHGSAATDDAQREGVIAGRARRNSNRGPNSRDRECHGYCV